MTIDPVKSGAAPAHKNDTDELVELGSMTGDTKGAQGTTWYDGGGGFFF